MSRSKVVSLGEAEQVPARVTPGVIERRILILAPTGNDARLSAEFLLSAGLAPKICSSAAELCSQALRGCGAIIIAEETLGADSATLFVNTLAEQPAWSDIPVTIITSGGEASQLQLRRLAVFTKGGNITLLERPFRPGTLVSILEVALRSRHRQYESRNLIAELSDARARIEATLGMANIGTWVWDIPNDRMVADRNLARLFSLSLKDVTAGPIEQFLRGVHGQDRARVRRLFDTALRSEKGEVETDFRIPQPDGSIRWVTARGKLERDSQGKPFRLPGVVIDITERKQQEKMVKLLARRVEDQARIFDTTLSHINDFAYIFDLKGRFLYANKPLLNLLGMSMSQAMGKNFFDLQYPERLAAKLQRQIQKVVKTKKSVRGEYASKNGSDGFYEYIFNPILSANGRVEMVAGSTRDITAFKRQQAELLTTSQAKDNFLAALSHELRTPLNPALLVASENALDMELPARARSDFELVRKSIELEARLIDDLLDLTRISRGKLLLKKDTIDLHVILLDALQTVEDDAKQKQISLHMDFGAEAHQVTGDAVRLQQIFWNILRNAVKFTPQNGHITVKTAAGQKKGRVLVRVIDTGIGMTPTEIAQAFDAFSQGEHAKAGSSHSFGGLGLGLAISRLLVRHHSGLIYATSAGRDRGSTITVELPLASAGAGHDSVASAPAMQPVPPLKNREELRILLVEDHEATRIALAQLLTRRRHSVSSASCVGEALALAREGEFDLVLSDIGLPDGDGYSLMAQLRDSFGLKGIALTGYGMERDAERAHKAGFMAHLTKPIRIDALTEVLSKFVPSVKNGTHDHANEGAALSHLKPA